MSEEHETSSAGKEAFFITRSALIYLGLWVVSAYGYWLHQPYKLDISHILGIGFFGLVASFFLTLGTLILWENSGEHPMFVFRLFGLHHLARLRSRMPRWRRGFVSHAVGELERQRKIIKGWPITKENLDRLSRIEHLLTLAHERDNAAKDHVDLTLDQIEEGLKADVTSVAEVRAELRVVS